MMRYQEYSRIAEDGKKQRVTASFDANGSHPLSSSELAEMISAVEKKYEEIFDILQISRQDPNAADTPKRIAKMLVTELFRGRYVEPPSVTVFPNRKNVDELIINKGIRILSVCSHHWQPIIGECAIGYIPGDYLIGLSKLSRIVDWFARRPQIQEEMGEQIADYIQSLIQPKALGVVIRAKHYCMIARGVEADEDKSIMVTSVMRGLLTKDLSLREEFLHLVNP